MIYAPGVRNPRAATIPLQNASQVNTGFRATQQVTVHILSPNGRINFTLKHELMEQIYGKYNAKIHNPGNIIYLLSRPSVASNETIQDANLKSTFLITVFSH